MLNYLRRKGNNVSNLLSNCSPKTRVKEWYITNEAKYEQWVNLGKLYMGVPYSTLTTFKFEITGK